MSLAVSLSLCVCVCVFVTASLQVSIVNVHIQHPPEAEVQVHQVARVKPGQGVRNHSRDGSSHSVQQRSQPASGHGNDHGLNNGNGNGGKISPQRPLSRQNGHVGRCFQETVDGQVKFFKSSHNHI